MRGDIIHLESVSKAFGSGQRAVLALRKIDLTVREGEFLVCIGPSGCGKSTLLYLVAGFERPSSGRILLDGRPVDGPGPDRGFVFQDYALFPWRTVLGNVMFGLRQCGCAHKEARRKARAFLRMVQLSEFEHAYPHTLSGGMKQRVGIARALAYEPRVLLMDEPFGALDAQTRKLLQGELVGLWESTAKTILFVTHSVIEAVYLADRVAVLTARPGGIKGIVDVNVPRPRQYTEEHYLGVRRTVLELLEEEVIKGAASRP